jgi:hypothetical protein
VKKIACLLLFFVNLSALSSAGLLRFRELQKKGDRPQLFVDGKPFLIFGGELGNSSAGTGGQADEILPRVATMHVNTVLIPVVWEQTEPVEGQFNFQILDHWIEVARQQHMHLVLLWFGSWKNAFLQLRPSMGKAGHTALSEGYFN